MKYKNHPNRKIVAKKSLKKWRVKNPQIQSLSRARKRRAIPRWANLRRIESVYKAAAEKLGFHVDHIIPLAHKLVCGLHVENNLRIISAKENLEKNNKLLPEYSG
ncbi:MAG: HNH endonuclease [Candidatus Brocadiaceae bacterium]|nr:HNH endonuclease [Candidatus Brocadiaceae bacterium]